MATISFVEVSPSTVMELNVVATTFFNIAFKNTAGMLASVKINANIVAILGAIIPEPLAIPDILINLLPILHSSYASFGLVSVVIIALAALNQTNLVCSLLNFLTTSGILFFIFA